jgi:glycosyltransferase involved in cell wall biosynthesis
MILGIDAANIRAGGGVTHLVELLRAAQPQAHGFERVIVWSSAATLARLDDQAWLRKAHVPLLDRGLAYRAFWQRFMLKSLAREAGCDVLFVPGGSDASGFKPMVTMNQNLLPFEWREMWRYRGSLTFLKLLLLRATQRRTFRVADGVIYLSKYARDVVLKVVGRSSGGSLIVPHGVNPRFLHAPRPPRKEAELSAARPFRLLYVSIVDVYKHQWQVCEAVAKLRSEGVPVVLDLVGPPGPALDRLKAVMRRLDPESQAMVYRGAVAYEQLHELYVSADLSVFASSCETFGQILTEMMSAGLPIASSNRSAMPEILGEAAEYFNPEKPEEIAAAIRRLVRSPERRAEMAGDAFQKAQFYSWHRCAQETFGFLAQVVQRFHRSAP